MHALDARCNVHVPCPISTGAYTVIRSKTALNISTSTTNDTVVLFGPHSNSSLTSPNVTTIIGIQGTGTDVPGVTETNLFDALMLNDTAGAEQLQLHALTLEVQNVGTATTASGTMSVGAMSGRINRAAYSTFNALSTALTSRREMREYSAYSTLAKPVVVCAAPLDPIQWSQFDALVGTTGGTSAQLSTDALTPIALVLPYTSAAANQYRVNVYCEWRVMYSTSGILASTHVVHKTTPNSFWDSVRSFVNNTGGVIANTISAVRSGFNAIGAFQSSYANFPRNSGLALTGRRPQLMLGN